MDDKQKILAAAATARALAYKSRKPLESADLYGDDTAQVWEGLKAIEYYAGLIIETNLKHNVKPVNISDMDEADTMVINKANNNN